MQRLALLNRQIVALVVGDEVDDRSLAKSGGFIELDAPVLDTCPKWTHRAKYTCSRVTPQ